MSISVKVVFFARIREALGVDQLDLGIETEQPVVQDVLSLLVSRGEPWQQALSSGQLLVAVNQEMTQLDQPLLEGDEVAFFPPVTGG